MCLYLLIDILKLLFHSFAKLDVRMLTLQVHPCFVVPEVHSNAPELHFFLSLHILGSNSEHWRRLWGFIYDSLEFPWSYSYDPKVTNRNRNLAQKKARVFHPDDEVTIDILTLTSFPYLVVSLIDGGSSSKEERNEKHPLGFRDFDKVDGAPNARLPLVISATIENHSVSEILIDDGSFAMLCALVSSGGWDYVIVISRWMKDRIS